MVAPTDKKVAKQVAAESLRGLGGTVTFTGGGEFQRRYLNDYSKESHRVHDEQAREAAALGPNISGPFNTLGGVREN